MGAAYWTWFEHAVFDMFIELHQRDVSIIVLVNNRSLNYQWFKQAGSLYLSYINKAKLESRTALFPGLNILKWLNEVKAIEMNVYSYNSHKLQKWKYLEVCREALGLLKRQKWEWILSLHWTFYRKGKASGLNGVGLTHLNNAQGPSGMRVIPSCMALGQFSVGLPSGYVRVKESRWLWFGWSND